MSIKESTITCGTVFVGRVAQGIPFSLDKKYVTNVGLSVTCTLSRKPYFFGGEQMTQEIWYSCAPGRGKCGNCAAIFKDKIDAILS